ncbi:MAG: hypothetical protein HDT39_07405 [Lachnospiraceae bacterium]|nr:hypothetical protein [Lachnospiraceae bacterium]
MGYSAVNLHVKLKNEEDEIKVKEYFDNSCDDTEGLMEDIPEEFRDAIMEEMGYNPVNGGFVNQSGYLSVCSEKVRFDNFEMVAEELSGTLGLDVLVALVFDSDAAVIQGYVSGTKILEEVNSAEDKKKMDRKLFIEHFAPDCTEEQIASVWDKEAGVFAEDILYEMGQIMGIKLIH